jgi:hypothetical protein
MCSAEIINQLNTAVKRQETEIAQLKVRRCV